MQILLACAKIINESTDRKTPLVSVPSFLKEAGHFALLMSQRSVEELMDMFNCSRQLAIENKLRFDRFFDDENNIPAVLAYNGQAYKCLQAHTLGDDELLYAQQHLWITSFLYGLLRPLDMIHPYRMEGKVVLDEKTMFNHWKPLLTDLLIESVKADDGILVHLATEEMQHLFDWKKVTKEVTIVHPQFLVTKNGKLKSITVYSKSCRGAMTRFVIKNRLHSPEALQAFEYEGFEYRPDYGDANHPFFIIS